MYLKLHEQASFNSQKLDTFDQKAFITPSNKGVTFQALNNSGMGKELLTYADSLAFMANNRPVKSDNSSLSPLEKARLNSFLDSIERKGIQYFLDHRLPNGLIPDRVLNVVVSKNHDTSGFASVAATGYSLTAFIMAVEKGMISKEKARQMVMQTLKFVDSVTPQINGGWLAHFMDPQTGELVKNTEVSTVDTALFFFNAFAAAEYFGGDVRNQVQKMYDKIDFDLMLSEDKQNPDKKSFHLGFHIKDGHRDMIPFKWEEYSEGILVSLLALGSDRVSDDVWLKGWDRSKNWQFAGKESFVCLPLFTYFYPHGFINFKNKLDKGNDNFFEASRNAVKMQIDYCKTQGYPDGLFGITACDGPQFYQPYQPRGNINFSVEDFIKKHNLPLDPADKIAPVKISEYVSNLPGDEKYLNGWPAHDGTIAPPAVIASLPFAEKEVAQAIKALRKLNLFNDKYGVSNAYNVYKSWKSDEALGIDLGSMLLMTDAYNSGHIHTLISQNPIGRKILRRAGLGDKN